MNKLIPFILIFGFSLACKPEKTVSEEQTETSYDFSNMKDIQIELNDSHTFSNYDDVVLKHLQWDADVNFDQKIIYATANWEIQNLKKSDKLVLDTYGLDILDVILDDNKPTQFQMLTDQSSAIFGTPLSIAIHPDTKLVSITYKTSPDAQAIQWLNPQQTAGKENPFLFTQSQAILARTWLPCMDSPGVRFTYSADVKVPNKLLALMSSENPTSKNDKGEYHFEMKQPIPSYLMALAVGDIEYQKIGKNSGVYAEPSVIEKSAKEFEDLPEMITVAENLYGPYRWGVYDILVLPPSFPFGGMENPRLTFATPTILAGDKSLTSLVAHELAHSWSGNLVTNASWDDFWLNEGFTVYFEQRIMEKLYGRDYSEMLASLSYEGLKQELEELPSADTHLYLDLEGRNPDDGLTAIAYDKGYLFLRNMEETIGRDKFDAFLRNYFDQYGFKVMNTKAFMELINDEIIKGDSELAKRINLEAWINGGGLPEDHPAPQSNRFASIDNLVKEFDLEKIKTESKAWSSHEWQHFIESLPADIGIEQMGKLDNAFGFTQSGNSEIQFDWYKLAIQNQYQPAYPAIENFLVNVGRRKFLTPLYKTMVDTGQDEWAKEIYAKARGNYHSVAYNTIDEIVK